MPLVIAKSLKNGGADPDDPDFDFDLLLLPDFKWDLDPDPIADPIADPAAAPKPEGGARSSFGFWC